MSESTLDLILRIEKEPLNLDRSNLLKTEARNSFVQEAYDFVKESPVRTAAIAAGAVLGGNLLLGLCRKIAANGSRIAENAAEKQVLQTASAEFRAGAGNLRSIEGKVLPDLERPFLAAGAPEQSLLVERVREAYAGDLISVYALPRKLGAEAGENLAAFSRRAFETRAAITKEKMTSEVVSKEMERISKLNGGLSEAADLSGRTLHVLDKESFLKIAEDLQFKHVPQIGQFLKGTGRIGEEQIEAALLIQRDLAQGGSRKLIGEILVENKLAAQIDVDLAFSRQQELKSALKAVREKFLTTVNPG